MLDLLRNKIDITQVPFSDRGSRLLIFKEQDQSRLYIKLAERLIGLDPALEAHVQRPPFIRDLCLLGPNGEALDFELETSPALLELTTAMGKFELAFRDESALAFGLPEGSTSGIRFTVQAEPYRAKGPGGKSHPVRIVSCSTNGTLVKNETIPIHGGELIETLVRSQSDCAIQLCITGAENGLAPPLREIKLAPFPEIRAAAIQRWVSWFDRIPPVVEQFQQTYAYAWWVLANNLVSPLGHIHFEAAMPTKAKYVGLWLWDSALHAVALRHIDPVLARNQILVFLAQQLPDGMLPDVVYDEGVVTEIDHPVHARVTKPPILAWAALKIHETAPDLAFLREIYEPLARWNAWWFDQSEGGNAGLAQYNHPYSSGLDDNPLWDEGMPVVSPDLNTYLCLQMKALGQIAAALGLRTEADQWRERSVALVQRMVANLWDAKAGYFRALRLGSPIQTLTPFNLYPLWTGDLPPEIRDLVVGHLKNREEFWGTIMLPTVARNDPKFSPGIMWRGPVWANINYFFIEALQTTGFHREAEELQAATLEMLMQPGGIYEYYHAETGRPPADAAPMFGWSAAVFIDLAIRASSLKNIDN